MNEKLAHAGAKQRLFYFNLSVVLAFSVLFGYWLFVRLSGIRLPCILSLVTHFYCPGCGGTRAAEALLRLDILASLAANSSLAVGLLTVLYYEVRLILGVRRKETRAPSLVPLYLFVAFFILYAVVRNVLLVYWHIDPLGDHLMYWSRV